MIMVDVAELPPLVAITYATGEGAVMGRVVAAAEAAGLRLAGMLQKDERRPDRRRCDMTLIDLATGREIALSQDRGRDARGCRLDHAALEDAAGHVATRLEAEPRPDLLILSKFGKREIEGHGFRQAIERAVDLGIPVLVGVTADHVDGFRAFGGGLEEVVGGVDEIVASIAGGGRR